MKTIIQAINDPKVFRAFVAGEPDGDLASWKNWLAFLRTLYGIKPLKRDYAVIRQATGRDPAKLSRDGFSECLLLAGRRSGKSKMIALAAAAEAVFSGKEKGFCTF